MRLSTRLSIICFVWCFSSAVKADFSFTLTNSAAFSRIDETVEIALPGEALAGLPSLALYDAANNSLPYQVSGKGKIVFQATLSAGSSVVYTLTTGTPAVAADKTYAAQKIPSNRNDIAWENDLAAHRMYSRVLLSSEPNTANGVDLWVKKKAEPVIDRMYTYSDYHSENPEGVDAYSVNGKTLGAGGVGAYAGSTLYLHDPYDECAITNNGPLQAEFTLSYYNVLIDGDYYTKTLRITTRANGLLDKAVVKLEGKIKPMKIAVGIFLHTNMSNVTPDGVQFTGEDNIIAYAENKSEGTVTSANARFYNAVYMPGETTTQVINHQLVIMSDYAVGSEFTYYFGGGWNIFPAGRYAQDQDWFDAVKKFKTSVENPLYSNAGTLPSKAEVINEGIRVNSLWQADHAASYLDNAWYSGVYHAGNMAFQSVCRRSDYLQYSRDWAESKSYGAGTHGTADADNVAVGQAYIDLYNLDETKTESKLTAIKSKIDNFTQQWWWIDAMYMAMPAYARLGATTGDSGYFEKMYALFKNTRDTLLVSTNSVLWSSELSNQYGAAPFAPGWTARESDGLYNPAEQLWYRDWGFQPGVPQKKDPNNGGSSDSDTSSDYCAKQTPSGKNIFWGRGNGWAIGAMAHTLKHLPENAPHRQEYVEILQDMAAALKNRQRPDGAWNMSLDDDSHRPGGETSGTALITFALAYGINSGLLDSATYYPTVAKAWNNLVKYSVQTNGVLSRIQGEGEAPIDPARLTNSRSTGEPKKVAFGVGAFLCACSEVAQLAQGSAESDLAPDYDMIMQRIRETEWKSVNAAALDAQASDALDNIQADGSWADINYSSMEQSNWQPVEHLNRLKNLALAYTLTASTLYGNADVFSALTGGLEYWHNADPRSSNWYMQQIACPQRIGVILILMRSGAQQLPAELETKLLARMKSIGGSPDQAGSQGSGANKINVAMHWMYRGLLTQNASVLSFGVEQAYLPIALTTGEGLQNDLSYFQHGQQFFTGGYGYDVISGVGRVANYTAGTQFQIPAGKLQLLTAFARDAFLKLIRGQYFMYNSVGRGLSRENGLQAASSAEVAKIIKELDLDHAGEYEAAVKRITGSENASFGMTTAQKHYYRGDYSLYYSPAYNFDIRMASTRTFRNENGNGENVKGYFLSEGAYNIAVDGDEYVDIFPAWNWTRIPGITAPQMASIPQPAQWGTYGTTTFAGGVSNGEYGITAFAPDNKEYSINTAAKKAWFMFGNEIVCLGAGITSTAAAEINTTVNQCLLNGAVTLSAGGVESVLENGTHSPANADWIYHNKTGYFFPAGGNPNVSLQAASGNWNAINTAAASKTETKDVFTLWFNHGTEPTAASYAYMIVPAKTKEEIKQYDADKVEILVNSDTLQALRHKTLNIYGFVFYRGASFANADFSLRSDKACVLMLKDAETASVSGWVADPTQLKKELTLRYASHAIAGEKEWKSELPQTPAAGSTVAFTIDDATPAYDPTAQKEYIVYPTDDAYERDGSYSATTYGTTEPQNLIVKMDNADGYRRQSSLKFDLTELAEVEIEKAQLSLFVRSANTNIAATTWELYYIADDNWSETTINWNNKPAYTTLLGSFPGSPANTEAIYDITQAVIAEVAKDNKLSVQVVSTQRADGKTDVFFVSKDSPETDMFPRITVTEKRKTVAVTTVLHQKVIALNNNPVRRGETAIATYNAATAGTASLTLYNLCGQAVAQNQYAALAGNNRLELNTAHLSAGIYIVCLTGNAGSASGIVKMAVE
jgi:chondroitin AC lyase